MADVSAESLAEFLLLGGQPERVEDLARILVADPPLLLWTVCTIAGHGDPRPQSVADCARWLREHALEVLYWPDGRRPWPSPIDPDQCGQMIAAAVLLGELAGQLAEESVDCDPAQATLLGLLHDAPRWGATVGQTPEDEGSPLPDWLSTSSNTATATVLARATEIVAGRQPPPNSPQIDLDACHDRSGQCRLRWLAPAGRLAEMLPAVAAKLSRLAVLENDFRHTVETEKLEAMAEFAAGAGHEINNPLTIIAGRSQLFLREETDPERRRALALINAQAMRVYEMIADMRLFARPPEPELEVIDMAELINRLVEELSPQYAGRAIDIKRTGTSGPVKLEVDPTQLTVALRAMCQNSAEAIGREGNVEIDLQQEAGEVRISIRDDGPGVTPEERRHLFDPYYSARQAGRGLGLGLSKCWSIVATNHGGRIDVQSQPGHGTTFLITLPRTHT